MTTLPTVPAMEFPLDNLSFRMRHPDAQRSDMSAATAPLCVICRPRASWHGLRHGHTMMGIFRKTKHQVLNVGSRQ